MPFNEAFGLVGWLSHRLTVLLCKPELIPQNPQWKGTTDSPELFSDLYTSTVVYMCRHRHTLSLSLIIVIIKDIF